MAEKNGRWKKIRPPTYLTFWRHLGRWKFCFLWLPAWEKYKNFFLICTEVERIRGEKLTFRRFGPLSALSVQIRPELCLAALLFIRPFLSYAAEESASWHTVFLLAASTLFSAFFRSASFLSASLFLPCLLFLREEDLSLSLLTVHGRPLHLPLLPITFSLSSPTTSIDSFSASSGEISCFSP